MISGLQLEAYRLQDLIVRFNEEWLSSTPPSPDTDLETYEVEPDFDVFNHATEDAVMVRLSVTCTGVAGDVPPRFNEVALTVWGRFAFGEGLSEEARLQLGSFNAVAMLHGIARGSLIQATGGCVGGPFILPSLDYRAIIEAKLADSTGVSGSPGPVDEPEDGVEA